MKKVVLDSSLILGSFIAMAGLMISIAVKEKSFAYLAVMELVFERTEDVFFFVACVFVLLVGIVLGISGITESKTN